MRNSVSSIAIIKSPKDACSGWLTQWNENWEKLSLIGGHREDGESSRECLVREVREELGLKEGIDFRVVGTSPVRVEFEAWSESARERTQYEFELFQVELISEGAVQSVSNDSRNRWVTEKEILEGRTRDGLQVSQTVGRLLAAHEGRKVP